MIQRLDERTVKCSNCGFVFRVPPTTPVDKIRCWCGAQNLTDEQRAALAASIIPCTGACPGDELAALFASFGLTIPCDGCKALLHDMNAWGPDECEQRKDAILERLAGNEAKLGWGEWMAAGMAAAKAGYLSRGQIVDEAIRRARVKAS